MKNQSKEQIARRIQVCQTLRMWMLVPAALLLIGGYAAGILPVLYGSALPLAVAALLTWRIKYLERSMPDD